VLLGYFDPHVAAVPPSVDVRVVPRGLSRIPALRGARSIGVRVERIADAGEDPTVPEPL
jgi:hypothetical protein